MASPDKQFLCSGQVKEWRYQGKSANSFRAIVWRPIVGSDTQFKIVGINDIPAGAVNTPVTYAVPENDRITVKPGDVIGWSFGSAVLTYNQGSTYRVRWVDGNLHASLQVDQVRDITSGVGNREYSIEAIVGNMCCHVMSMTLYQLIPHTLYCYWQFYNLPLVCSTSWLRN